MNWIRNQFQYHFDAPSKTSVRYFIVLFVLVLLGAGFFTKFNLMVALVLVFVQLLGLVFEKFWRFEYALLTVITEPLGKVVSFVVLLVLFYAFLTPLSFLRNKQFQSGWKDSAKQMDATQLYE